MANEVSSFKKRYLTYFKNNYSKDNICNWLEQAVDFERPDGYYYDSKTRLLIIFEHFVFNCSENIIKKGKSQGSLLHKELNDKYHEVQKEIQSATDNYESTKVIMQGYYEKNGNKTVIKIGENGDKYRNNYINNFKTAFNEHSAKIDEYKDNLIINLNIKPLETKVVFLIEDTTMFGSKFLEKGNSPWKPVILTNTLQFQDIINNSNVDFVIAACQNGDGGVNIGYKNDSSNKIDLNQTEFYIIAGAPYITFAKKTKL